MTTGAEPTAAAGLRPTRYIDRLRRGDTDRMVLAFVATLVLYIVVDQATRALAASEASDLERWSLTLAGLGRRPALTLLAVVAGGALAIWQPRRLFAPWNALQHGRALRLFTATIIVFVAWRFALYDYNWLAGRWHALDRLLVIALAALTLWRPVFLLGFIVVVRAVTEQFVSPLDIEIASNIQDFPVLALALVAAVVLLYVVTGDESTDALPLLLAVLVASHFFVPGIGKARTSWVSDNELANLPLNALAQGWGASGDGGRAEGIHDAIDYARWWFVAATLMLELGFVAALVHRNLVRLWLVGAVAFHAMTFAVLGFVFIDWVVVELAVLALLTVPSLGGWVQTSFRPLRVIIAVVVVLGFSSLVFHPPNLAWFDSKVTYAYRVEVDTTDGATLVVEPRDLSPYVQELAFSMIKLGPARPAAGPYGAASRSQFDALAPVTDLDDLAQLEATLDPLSDGELARARALLVEFVRASHRNDPSMPLPSAPHEFQIDLGGPRYDGEPIERLRVTRLTTLRVDGTEQVRRELALELELVDDEPTIVD